MNNQKVIDNTVARVKDENYMGIAINEAEAGTYPFGAVIVQKDEVIGKAGAAGLDPANPGVYAEVIAMKNALDLLGTRTLRDATMYLTCEPSTSGFKAMRNTGVTRVVYGATTVDVMDGSRGELSLEPVSTNDLTSRDINTIPTSGGVCKEKVLEMVSNWGMRQIVLRTTAQSSVDIAVRTGSTGGAKK